MNQILAVSSYSTYVLVILDNIIALNLQVEDAEKRTEKTAEEITEKYGLEAGLWNVFRSKGDGKGTKGTQAKDLLKRYGSAYLITSISFAIVSFSLCYALVGAGQYPLT